VNDSAVGDNGQSTAVEIFEEPAADDVRLGASPGLDDLLQVCRHFAYGFVSRAAKTLQLRYCQRYTGYTREYRCYPCFFAILCPEKVCDTLAGNDP